MAEQPILLTKDQVAVLLSISVRTLEREISIGRFPAPVKVGRSIRIPRSDVQAYVDGLRSPEGKAAFFDGIPKDGPHQYQDMDICDLITRRFSQLPGIQNLPTTHNK